MTREPVAREVRWGAMTYRSSSAEAYVPPQAIFAPPTAMPPPTAANELTPAPTTTGRMPPGPGLVFVAAGWLVVAAVMLGLGGMVFLGILQAAAGG